MFVGCLVLVLCEFQKIFLKVQKLNYLLICSVQMMTSLRFAGGLLMCALGQACFAWLKNTLSLPNTKSVETNKKFLLISVGFGSLLCSASWNNKTKHKTSWSEFPLVCFAAKSQCGVIHPLSALPSKVSCAFICLFALRKLLYIIYLVINLMWRSWLGRVFCITAER